MRGRTGRSGVLPRVGEKVCSYPVNRVCATDECKTVLSRYNGSEFCSVHQPYTRRTGGGRP